MSHAPNMLPSPSSTLCLPPITHMLKFLHKEQLENPSRGGILQSKKKKTRGTTTKTTCWKEERATNPKIWKIWRKPTKTDVIDIGKSNEEEEDMTRIK